MTRSRKNGRGDGCPRSRPQGGGNHHPYNTGKRIRTGRVSSGGANAPSAAFLEALEAQRAKQVTDGAGPGTTSDGDKSLRPPRDHAVTASKQAALPGFYFDEVKGRYYKLTTHHEQLQKKLRVEESNTQSCSGEKESSLHRVGVRSLRRRGWLGFMLERETLNVVSARYRDQRCLISRYLASQLTSQRLDPVNVGINATRDKFTTMEVNSDSTVLYIGSASGQVQSYSIPTDSSQFRSISPLGSVDMDAYMVSSIRCSLNGCGFLVSAVGSGTARELTSLLARGSTRNRSGRVSLYRADTFHQAPLVWQLDDSWVTEWSPTQANIFSVGLGGHQGAVIVDFQASCSAESSTVAPRGRIKSDTLSQSFSHHSSAIVVNGTRNGSWWTWDSRAPSRATEVIPQNSLSNAGILCLRALSDDRRLLIHKSDGRLAVIDLRSSLHQPVTSILRGNSQVYRSMLRFDTDESESVVAATTKNSITIFNLSSGDALGEVNATGSCKSDQGLEQAHLRSTSGGYVLWSLSRSQVFRSKHIRIG